MAYLRWILTNVGEEMLLSRKYPKACRKRRENHVRHALDVPEDRRVVAILGLGYPETEPVAKEMLPRESMVHYEKFSQS